eukprot:TRINITY_DN767_c0_g1_i3.p1 TRINITY_DN767_c0_g1~~TRINITY_DN767_c0_g1_i3.p1  ORF type:complete len:1045 (-),score=247.16 TRINITY_DN767_c0_g1_i3:182-3316(-)
MDNKTSNRPERRTALVGRELQRYNIDIAALSETRFADTGELTEAGAGYTFFWSGKARDEPREAGVGFAIRTNLVRKLESLPRGINDRLMVMRLPLAGKSHLTLISAYAQTMTYSLERKEMFYQDLRNVMQSAPKEDKILLLGDFNARVGRDYRAWPGVLGPHGIGMENSNGQLLLSFCAEHGLTITNTLFKLPDIHKTTWMHPRSKHWHQIDYVITRRCDIRDVRITRVMRGADCWTDHMLLRSKLSFRIAYKHRLQRSDIRKKLDVRKLADPSVKETLTHNLEEQIGNLPAAEDSDKSWANFRDSVYSSAKLVLGHPERKHQDWFDDNNQQIAGLLKEKQEAFDSWLSDKRSVSKHECLKHLRNKVQRELRQMEDKWWEAKAAELQQYAEEHNTKKLFDGLKTVYGPSSNAMAPVRSTDGTLLTERSDIVQRWTDHFSQLLNRPSQIDQQAIQDIPQRPVIESLDDPPTLDEVTKAIKQLQPGKAPGPDGIPPELYKEGGKTLTAKLTELMQQFWTEGSVPQDFKDANIVHLYKNKGDRASCDNHRGISLLSIAGKIMARVILNRITSNLLDDVVSESQCGFRRNRGTIDMIFAIRQIQEKCREQNKHLYVLFVDLTKAFDTVSREGLWVILSRLGCPPKFITIIRSFHDGMMARVIENGSMSDPFPVSNGVKQGCVLAPTLFSLLFATMLFAAMSQTDAGITIRYRTDGRFFDLRRLKTRTKVLEALVRDFLFADDCALAAHSEPDLQELANCLSAAARSFGLTISLKKTEVLAQPAPGLVLPDPAITIEGTQLNNVDTFTYLGSCITSTCSMDREVSNRISKASASFGRLSARVWNERGLTQKTKIAVYKAVVLTSLLYGCETWTLYRRQVKTLDQFHLRCLRRILRISWQDGVSNTEVLRRAQASGIEALIIRSQLRWVGHVVRMDDSRLPKSIFFSELASGTRKAGAPVKRYKDSLKSSLKACNTPVTGWERLANDRSAWRHAIHKGINTFETQRLESLDQKRQARKERRPDPAAAVACPTCGRICASAFGLQSHLRRH